MIFWLTGITVILDFKMAGIILTDVILVTDYKVCILCQWNLIWFSFWYCDEIAAIQNIIGSLIGMTAILNFKMAANILKDLGFEFYITQILSK